MTEQYRNYLQSPQWLRLRYGCIAKAGRACEACRGAERLQAHHLTYERIFQERLSDLMCLCKPCHEEAEGYVKSGIIPRRGNTANLRQMTLRKLSRALKVHKEEEWGELEQRIQHCTNYGRFRRFLNEYYQGHRKKGKRVARAVATWRMIHGPF